MKKFILLLILITHNCGSNDDPKVKVTNYAKIQLDPPEEEIIFDKSIVPIGDIYSYTITMRNVGTDDLNILNIECSYSAITEEEKKHGSAITFELPPIFPVVISPLEGTGEYSKTLALSVKFKHYDDKEERSAVCTINSNSYGREEFDVVFKTKESEAHIEVPSLVDFELVGEGENASKDIIISNAGSSKLHIFGFQLTGDKHFSIKLQDKEYSVSEETMAGINLDPDIIVETNSSLTIQASFKPETGETASAKLYLTNNAENAVNGISTVELVGNTGGACIKVSPSSVNFGGSQVGLEKLIKVKIESCGSSLLSIADISMDEKSSKDFDLDFSYLPDAEAPTEKNPISIEPNAVVEFGVTCQPDVVNPKDLEGKPIPDQGDVLITNNSFNKIVKIHLSCVGVPNECPLPKITIDEGEEVKPQTFLHLHGEQSQAGNGIIEEYIWKVEQPKENMQQLVPSAKVSSPSFWANVAGKYTFTLDVVDSSGTCSCDPGCMSYQTDVVVIPQQAIHVELTWETPNDPDPYDEGPEAGSDMDLHFVHPYAGGPDIDGDGEPDPWFDMPFDCFWYEINPNWASFDQEADDNPSLDRDDTDGAGPENLNLNIPEPGKTYRVGVHYWDDHGFGLSDAKVKIYIYQEPVAEFSCQGLKMLDLWKVAKIKWPEGTVEVWSEECNIVHNYQNPSFQPFL